MNTKNYNKCMNIINNHISITDLVRLYDSIALLKSFIPLDNEVHDTVDDLTISLRNVVKDCGTKINCPHCNDYLFLSDLPDYDYVCVNCDENFYECEVK